MQNSQDRCYNCFKTILQCKVIGFRNMGRFLKIVIDEQPQSVNRFEWVTCTFFCINLKNKSLV